MIHRNDDFYPPRPEKDWHKKPFSPQDPRLGEALKKPEPPKVLTIADLFPRIDRWGIGWSPILEELKNISNEKPSYPPYDIVDRKDDITVVSVAVAGFVKSDLSITIDDNVLRIEGTKERKKAEGEVVYSGIASRDFTLTFAIAEYYEVKDATLADGMLTVTLFKNLPEDKKPKTIEIN
jgi:molecular chaperone IbpA